MKNLTSTIYQMRKKVESCEVIPVCATDNQALVLIRQYQDLTGQ